MQSGFVTADINNSCYSLFDASSHTCQRHVHLIGRMTRMFSGCQVGNCEIGLTPWHLLSQPYSTASLILCAAWNESINAQHRKIEGQIYLVGYAIIFEYPSIASLSYGPCVNNRDLSFQTSVQPAPSVRFQILRDHLLVRT
jgi:hypothetical protein